MPDLRSRKEILKTARKHVLARAIHEAWNTVCNPHVAISATTATFDERGDTLELQELISDGSLGFSWYDREDWTRFLERAERSLVALDQALLILERALAKEGLKDGIATRRYRADALYLHHVLLVHRFTIGEALVEARKLPQDAFKNPELIPGLDPVALVSSERDSGQKTLRVSQVSRSRRSACRTCRRIAAHVPQSPRRNPVRRARRTQRHLHHTSRVVEDRDRCALARIPRRERHTARPSIHSGLASHRRPRERRTRQVTSPGSQHLADQGRIRGISREDRTQRSADLDIEKPSHVLHRTRKRRIRRIQRDRGEIQARTGERGTIRDDEACRGSPFRIENAEETFESRSSEREETRRHGNDSRIPWIDQAQRECAAHVRREHDIRLQGRLRVGQLDREALTGRRIGTSGSQPFTGVGAVDRTETCEVIPRELLVALSLDMWTHHVDAAPGPRMPEPERMAEFMCHDRTEVEFVPRVRTARSHAPGKRSAVCIPPHEADVETAQVVSVVVVANRCRIGLGQGIQSHDVDTIISDLIDGRSPRVQKAKLADATFVPDLDRVLQRALDGIQVTCRCQGHHRLAEVYRNARMAPRPTIAQQRVIRTGIEPATRGLLRSSRSEQVHERKTRSVTALRHLNLEPRETSLGARIQGVTEDAEVQAGFARLQREIRAPDA